MNVSGGIMAKRFTDTDKWKKEDYCDLSCKLKCVWQYMLDTCDAAGIWEMNLKLMAVQVGEPVTKEEIEFAFAAKLFSMGKKTYWIPAFITFQYGVLKQESRPHLSVINILKKHALYEEYLKGIQALKEKEQIQEQDKVKGGSVRGDFSVEDLADLWNLLTSKAKLPNVIEITEDRRAAAAVALNSCQDASVWREVIKKITGVPFLTGTNKDGWKANFDFLIKPGTRVKILENAYGDESEDMLKIIAGEFNATH
jgi:hypothetical protein